MHPKLSFWWKKFFPRWTINILWSLILVGSCTQTNASQLSLIKHTNYGINPNFWKSWISSLQPYTYKLDIKTLWICERGMEIKLLSLLFTLSHISFPSFWHGFNTINSKWACVDFTAAVLWEDARLASVTRLKLCGLGDTDWDEGHMISRSVLAWRLPSCSLIRRRISVCSCCAAYILPVQHFIC